jgi:hypothetical protein
MSHTTTLYPLSTGGLTLTGDSAFQVREEGPDYRPFSKVLLEYSDLVEEKLPQVRTVALLLRDPLPPGGAEGLGALIADLIDDVMLAHKAMWAEYERQREK